jgi:hypothetical protein
MRRPSLSSTKVELAGSSTGKTLSADASRTVAIVNVRQL